jgi:hypothetical protein
MEQRKYSESTSDAPPDRKQNFRLPISAPQPPALHFPRASRRREDPIRRIAFRQ